MTPRSKHGLADGVIAAMLALLGLILYSALGLRLAQGGYLDYYNLAFDFDPVRTVDALAGSPPDFLGVKHPLVVLLRPLAWPMLWAGATAKQATVLVMAGFGSASVALCFAFLRQAGIDRPIAAALGLLFLVSGTQLFTGFIAETYGIAGFSIVLTWTIAAARVADPSRFRRLRFATGVLVFGTTVTNVIQTFIAELLVAWNWLGFRRAAWRSLRFATILALLLTILLAAVWFGDLKRELADPILALKHVYWLRTSGTRTGPVQVATVFCLFSFVSPDYSWLRLPEGIDMRDFRVYAFPLAGQIAAPLWLIFAAAGSVGACLHPRYRTLAAGTGVALAFNLLFHLDFQFRGSVYIYAAHTHFLVFTLGSGLAPFVSYATRLGKVYMGVVLLLVALVGADNLPAAQAFAADFDHVAPGCAAPCADLPQR